MRTEIIKFIGTKLMDSLVKSNLPEKRRAEIVNVSNEKSGKGKEILDILETFLDVGIEVMEEIQKGGGCGGPPRSLHCRACGLELIEVPMGFLEDTGEIRTESACPQSDKAGVKQGSSLWPLSSIYGPYIHHEGNYSTVV